jgi:hypothetical protein
VIAFAVIGRSDEEIGPLEDRPSSRVPKTICAFPKERAQIDRDVPVRELVVGTQRR